MRFLSIRAPFPRPARRRLVVPVFLLGTASVVACGSDSPTDPVRPPVSPVPTFVRLESEPGDFVGGGQTYAYTQSNALIKVGETDHLEFSVYGAELWVGDMIIFKPLRVGTSIDLPRCDYSYNVPSFALSGGSRGCRTSRTTVMIDSVSYYDNQLITLDMRFEQHCDGAVPALRGTIHWNG